MVLDDLSIKELGLIKEGFNPDNLQPASYDLTFNEVSSILDLEKEEMEPIFDNDVECAGCYALAPGKSVLFSTKEVVELPDNIAATLKDKSSYSRLGMRINQGWIDPGFEGNLTVLVQNTGNVEIWISQGQPFCQIVFEEVKRNATNAYNGHYQNQRGVTYCSLKEPKC